MTDTVRVASGESVGDPAGARPEGEPAAVLLKQGIAALAPVPLAQGAFGQVYLGKILNPLGLLAERIVWGEESPRWLGLTDIPYEESDPASPRLPSPILDPDHRERVYAAATRLWQEYRERRKEDPARANEEFKDWLGLIDPLLREDRTIAVKVLHASRSDVRTDASGTPGETLRRFIKENDLLRRLEHPGIVRRFGLVRDPGMGWCLLLEYIDGETLEDHLGKFEGRRMPLPLATRIIGELAAAIDYVHEKGIVHHDLKPQNVMIRRESGSAVIMDFGIGKWISESAAEQLTMVGVRLGTPRYMAPEQAAAGDVQATPLTDVYQLSTLLFEMVTGHAAYESDQSEEIFAWLTDPTRRHPTCVHDFFPGISQELETLIEVGREKDARSRWTLAEFRGRLESVAREGHFEKRRQRKLMSSVELGRALVEARTRRKEALWKEHVIERELAQAEARERLEEVRGHLQTGEWEKARAGLDRLCSDRSLLPRFADDFETLEKALRFGTAREDAGMLIVRAEMENSQERYVDLGATLGEVAPKMRLLPRKSCSDLHERWKRLSRRFDADHRSFVELFAALRSAFVEKIRSDYHRLHDEYGAGQAIEESRVADVLGKVEAARKNLRTIDPSKVGRIVYESVERDLAEQEIALRDLGKRIRSARPE